MRVSVSQSCLTHDSMAVAFQALLFMGFFRQEHWSVLPFPSPGIEPGSPAWQADSLPTEPPGKP